MHDLGQFVTRLQPRSFAKKKQKQEGEHSMMFAECCSFGFAQMQLWDMLQVSAAGCAIDENGDRKA